MLDGVLLGVLLGCCWIVVGVLLEPSGDVVGVVAEVLHSSTAQQLNSSIFLGGTPKLWENCATLLYSFTLLLREAVVAPCSCSPRWLPFAKQVLGCAKQVRGL